MFLFNVLVICTWPGASGATTVVSVMVCFYDYVHLVNTFIIISLSLSLSIYIYIYLYTYTHSIYVRVRPDRPRRRTTIYICIYIYIYIYTHIYLSISLSLYIYIYIYIYTHTQDDGRLDGLRRRGRPGEELDIAAIFYPFSQFCEIGISLLSLDYGKYAGYILSLLSLLSLSLLLLLLLLIYIYIYIHLFIYIYIYIEREREKERDIIVSISCLVRLSHRRGTLKGVPTVKSPNNEFQVTVIFKSLKSNLFSEPLLAYPFCGTVKVVCIYIYIYIERERERYSRVLLHVCV